MLQEHEMIMKTAKLDCVADYWPLVDAVPLAVHVAPSFHVRYVRVHAGVTFFCTPLAVCDLVVQSDSNVELQQRSLVVT